MCLCIITFIPCDHFIEYFLIYFRVKSPCQNSSSYQNVGAFAPSSNLPDAVYPELAFLEKPFLNLSRGAFQCNGRKSVDNINNTDSNLNIIDTPKKPKTDDCQEKDFEKLCSGVSCTDLSDGSDFVLIDVVSVLLYVVNKYNDMSFHNLLL